VTTPISGAVSSVDWDLLCSTHIPHLKCLRLPEEINEEMKGNAKCKNSRFEPPFGGLKDNIQVHLWLDRKRVVDFLSAIIELFSLALAAAALLSEICRNLRFLKGVDHFERKF